MSHTNALRKQKKERGVDLLFALCILSSSFIHSKFFFNPKDQSLQDPWGLL